MADHLTHEHVWQDTGYANVEYCAICGAAKSGDTTEPQGAVAKLLRRKVREKRAEVLRLRAEVERLRARVAALEDAGNAMERTLFDIFDGRSAMPRRAARVAVRDWKAVRGPAVTSRHTRRRPRLLPPCPTCTTSAADPDQRPEEDDSRG